MCLGYPRVEGMVNKKARISSPDLPDTVQVLVSSVSGQSYENILFLRLFFVISISFSTQINFLNVSFTLRQISIDSNLSESK